MEKHFHLQVHPQLKAEKQYGIEVIQKRVLHVSKLMIEIVYSSEIPKKEDH